MNFRDTFLVSCCPNSKRDKMEVHEIYQIAELISACIRGEILPAEKQQILDRWIKASEENQKLFDHFRHYRFLEQKRIAENLYDIEICRIQGEKPKSNEILGYPDDNT